MIPLKNLVSAAWIRLVILADGLTAVYRLTQIALKNGKEDRGNFKAGLTASLTSPTGLRLVLTLLRAFLPNLALKRKFVTAYENNGTVVVTRFDDVKDVLARDGDFEVVYGPRMRNITGGPNFFLGMQDSSDYTRDVANMRLAVRRDDLAAVIKPFASRLAASLVQASGGRIDAPADLTTRVPAQLVGHYFGTPGPSETAMIEWTTAMFWYLFIDLKADPSLDARALEAASKCRDYLDATIQARKASPTDADDVLNRCLRMQGAGMPGMDDAGIRNNLIGLLIGAVPTTSKAAILALNQLLDRPAALAGAQDAARADDDEALATYVFEALRFNPVNPLIYRRATRETVIAANTRRAVRVQPGRLVMAANLSAMFDRLRLMAPDTFRIDRPADHYLLWGDGMHKCFGAHINQVLIPAILKPLLAQKKLQRAAGPDGHIDVLGTPFPVHMQLVFEA